MSQWENDHHDDVELRCKGNYSRFFWNNYELEKHMSHNPHCKLPLLETVTGDDRSFNQFCAMCKDSASNNLILFAKNVDEMDETELMFKDQPQIIDNKMCEHLNCNANHKQKPFLISATSGSD